MRAYNKNFNYFSGLSNKDIAKFQKDALTGHRPTWPTDFSNGTSKKTAASYARIRSGTAAYQNRMRDPFTLFNKRHSTNNSSRRLKPLEAKAFDTLGLQANASSEDIKMKYKELVKNIILILMVATALQKNVFAMFYTLIICSGKLVCAKKIHSNTLILFSL